MNAIGNTELTSNELPGQLEFRVDSTRGWLVFLILVILPLGFLIASLFVSVPNLRLTFSLLSLGWLAWMLILAQRSWNRTDTTTLTVTGQLFTAKGAGLKWSRSATVVVPTSEVKSFGFASGGEDEPSGLYVSCSFWNSKCLLPGLTRQQGNAVAVAIARRFPEIASKMK
jgi:hypothetical protein